jgi:hypothetical protein
MLLVSQSSFGSKLENRNLSYADSYSEHAEATDRT